MTAYPGRRWEIVCSLMGLPILLGGDKAWNQTRVCSNSSSIEMQCLRPLHYLGAPAYNDILDNSVLLTLWQQYGEGPFLFQHDNASMHKARSIQKLFVEIGVEKLHWPAQNPDRNPIEHQT